MRLMITLLFFVFSHCLRAQEIAFSPLFSPHVVLQKGLDIPVWGKATSGTTVMIHLAGQQRTTVSDHNGKWSVRFAPMSYGGPHTLKLLTEKDSVLVEDVMIGEVWVASGQSNMEFTMEAAGSAHSGRDIAAANFPQIRYFNVPRKTSILPIDTLEGGQWLPVNPATVRKLSAVAFYFARELHADKNVAVGIISSSWGATSAQAWMSAEMLATHPDFRRQVMSQHRDAEKWNEMVRQSMTVDRTRDSLADAATEGIRMGVQKAEYRDDSWKEVSYPIDMVKARLPGSWGVSWYRYAFDLATEKTQRLRIYLRAKEARLYLNGTEILRKGNIDEELQLNVPAGLLQKGKNLLTIRVYQNWGTALIGSADRKAQLEDAKGKKTADLMGAWKVNGAIEKPLPGGQNFYNQPSVQFNARISPLMPYAIRGVLWYQGEGNASKAFQYRSLFPLLIHDWRIHWQQGNFPFLFVQLANFREKKNEPGDDDWAELREAQTMTLHLPLTGMASAIDIGEERDIHPKNKLDVGKRLYLSARRIAYGDTSMVSEGPVFQSMKMEGEFVRLTFSSVGSGLMTRNNDPLKGFAVCGPDKKFYWADARIEGNTVMLRSASVSNPQAVRYNWASNPDGNLYNREGLPADAFRTDTFKGITE